MAIAPTVEKLTYEAYLAEPESNLRCEILDGERVMSNPTRRHQEIVMEIAFALYQYAREAKDCKAILAPSDILIRRYPLRVREPDVYLISTERLAQSPPDTDPAPLEVAPELVVEVLSPSETRRAIMEKMEDYRSVGVLECWLVHPEEGTLEVLRLDEAGTHFAGIYGGAERVVSLAFPGLEFLAKSAFPVA
jgi:Uma2 family endonuclease